MKPNYSCISLKCSFSFEELLKLNNDITLKDDYILHGVVINALWNYYEILKKLYLMYKLHNQIGILNGVNIYFNLSGNGKSIWMDAIKRKSRN